MLLLVLWKTPQPELLGKVFAAAIGWELALAVALNFALVALKVWRWQRLLAADHIDYAFGPAWRAFNAASYVALLTPGRIGDLLRVGYLGRDRRVPVSRALGSVVLDRLCDVLVLAACAGLGLIWLGAHSLGKLGALTWAGFGAFVCGGAGALALLGHRRTGDWLAQRVLGRLFANSAPAAFIDSCRTSLRGAWASALGLTTLAFAVVFVQSYLLALALDLPLALLDVIAMQAVTTLFGLLPISISGVGVRELLLSALFPALGLAATLGVAYGLLVFAVMYLPMVLYGLFVWERHPL